MNVVTFQRSTATMQGHLFLCTVGGEQRSIDLRAHFDTNQFVSFRVKEVASNFNDLYVGDLAFLAMAIGMKNSSGAHCAHCLLKASEFNVDMQLPNDARTKASLRTCLNEHHRLRTCLLYTSDAADE